MELLANGQTSFLQHRLFLLRENDKKRRMLHTNFVTNTLDFEATIWLYLKMSKCGNILLQTSILNSFGNFAHNMDFQTPRRLGTKALRA